jgi:hypothetical protein
MTNVIPVLTDAAAQTRAALDRISRAVQRQQLAGADLTALRQTIALLADLETEHRIVRAGLRNLRIADTQLKDIQARQFGPVLDDAAFATLPAHLRRRVLLRLGNIAGRIDREAARRTSAVKPQAVTPSTTPAVLPGEAPEIDPAFKCVRDCRACEAAPDASAFWCQLSLVICLLRTVLPALTSRTEAATAPVAAQSRATLVTRR